LGKEKPLVISRRDAEDTERNAQPLLCDSASPPETLAVDPVGLTDG